MVDYPTPPFLRRKKPTPQDAIPSTTNLRATQRPDDPRVGLPRHTGARNVLDEYREAVRKQAQKESRRRLEQYRTKEPEPGILSFYSVPPADFGAYEVIPGQTGQTSPVLGAVFEVLISHDHQRSVRRFCYPLHEIDDSVNGIACGLIAMPDDPDDHTPTTHQS